MRYVKSPQMALVLIVKPTHLDTDEFVVRCTLKGSAELGWEKKMSECVACSRHIGHSKEDGRVVCRIRNRRKVEESK